MPQALHFFFFQYAHTCFSSTSCHFFFSDLPPHQHFCHAISLCVPTPFQHVHSNYVHEDMNDTLSLGYLSMLQYISLSLSAGVDVSWLNGGHHLLQGRTH